MNPTALPPFADSAQRRGPQTTPPPPETAAGGFAAVMQTLAAAPGVPRQPQQPDVPPAAARTSPGGEAAAAPALPPVAPHRPSVPQPSPGGIHRSDVWSEEAWSEEVGSQSGQPRSHAVRFEPPPEQDMPRLPADSGLRIESIESFRAAPQPIMPALTEMADGDAGGLPQARTAQPVATLTLATSASPAPPAMQHRIVLSLDMPDGGRVTAALQSFEGRIEVRLQPDTVETRALVEAHREEIIAALALRHVDVAALVILRPDPALTDLASLARLGGVPDKTSFSDAQDDSSRRNPDARESAQGESDAPPRRRPGRRNYF